MRYKILIVDDETNVRFVIKEALLGAYQVFTAAEGLAAMEIVKKERPMMVFLDIKMPGPSGLEVLRLIKETGLNPVIWMLTGEEDMDVAIQTLKMGAAGYLTKPFEVQKIRDIVMNAVDDSRKKEQHDTRGDRPWRVKKSK